MARAFRSTREPECWSGARDWMSAWPGRALACRSVRELVNLNGGIIDIDQSALGGARIEVKIAPV